MFNRFKELKLIESDIDSFSKLTFYKGKGCSRCNGSGYHKRIAVLELLENNKEIGDCIIQNCTSVEIDSVAKKNGMITIFEDGMQKVLLGMTTIEEVLRIKRV